MPRLFITTFLSTGEQSRFAELAKQNDHLESLWQQKPRWVKPEKLHLTWLFLGNVEKALVTKVGSTLHKVMHEHSRSVSDGGGKAFTLELEKVEVWPNSRRPRVIVIAHQPVISQTKTLGRAIRTGMIPFYTEETEHERNQDFKPHVTLLRLNRREEILGKPLLATPRVEPNAITLLTEKLPIKLLVSEVCLVESHLSDLGSSTYTILDSVKLPT